MNDRLQVVWQKLADVAPEFDIRHCPRIETISLAFVGNVDGRSTWDVALRLRTANSAIVLVLKSAWIHSMPELAQGEPQLAFLEIEDIHSWQRPPYRFRVFEAPHDDNVMRGSLLECYCREIDVLPADQMPALISRCE